MDNGLLGFLSPAKYPPFGGGTHFCKTFPSPLNNLCLPDDREFLVLAKDVYMKEALILQFLKGDGRI